MNPQTILCRSSLRTQRSPTRETGARQFRIEGLIREGSRLNYSGYYRHGLTCTPKCIIIPLPFISSRNVSLKRALSTSAKHKVVQYSLSNKGTQSLPSSVLFSLWPTNAQKEAYLQSQNRRIENSVPGKIAFPSFLTFHRASTERKFMFIKCEDPPHESL